MGSYSLALHVSAEADLRASPFPFRRQIVQALHKLKAQPRPEGAEAIEAGLYRLNVHGWFVAYEVDDAASRITIFRVYR